MPVDASMSTTCASDEENFDKREAKKFAARQWLATVRLDLLLTPQGERLRGAVAVALADALDFQDRRH